MTDIDTQLGHVHVKVSDLERAVAFYTRFLGLEVSERVDGKKGSFAFLSAGRRHHDLALQHSTWSREPEEEEGTVRGSPVAGVGLYHVAFEVPDEPSLADALFELRREGIPVTAVDHGISHALYFSDPDGNGVEVYTDLRGNGDGREEWTGESRLLSVEQLLSPEQLHELKRVRDERRAARERDAAGSDRAAGSEDDADGPVREGSARVDPPASG